MIPPKENRPGPIDRHMPDDEQGNPKLWLIGQLCRRPLGREPDVGEDDREDDEYLADQQLGGGHGGSPPAQ